MSGGNEITLPSRNASLLYGGRSRSRTLSLNLGALRSQRDHSLGDGVGGRKQNIFLDLLGDVTKPGLVPAWRHPNAPRPRRDEPRPDPLDHVERNHGEDDETGRIRHRPVSPSERLLSTELVPIMPLYAVATGPIIGSLSPCDRRLSVEGSLVRPGGGLLSRRDCICLFIEYNLV